LAVGATDTYFNEPHGCFADNKSTPMDLNQIITASAQYNSILLLNRITNTTLSDVYIENVNNYLLLQFPEMIKICKTGLNISAGYSLSMLVEKNQKIYTISILGLDSFQNRVDLWHKILAKNNQLLF
jgi:D-alanyl-D-alanine carboxypeptidase